VAGVGAREAFEEIVRREGDGLFRFLYWFLGDREEALDALQETLLRAFQGFSGLRDPASAKPWFFTIATNVARRLHGKRKRRPRTFGIAPGEDARLALLGAGEATPLANLEASETDRRLADALGSIEPELREPLLLFTVSGLKYREIAESLKWPEGTVTTRIHVARERLAKILGPS
jgi:RNA polymerase sigma-70 factor (ECF subfamily)